MAQMPVLVRRFIETVLELKAGQVRLAWSEFQAGIWEKVGRNKIPTWNCVRGGLANYQVKSHPDMERKTLNEPWNYVPPFPLVGSP